MYTGVIDTLLVLLKATCF